MSSSKSKSRDEARYESKRHRKSKIHKKSKKDFLDDSLEGKNKEKRKEYDERNQRINNEDDDYRSEFNRKKREDKYNFDKSVNSESDDNHVEYRRKSKSGISKRTDKENDFYNAKNSDKEDERTRKDENKHDKKNKRKQKHAERDEELYPEDDFAKKDGQKRKRDNIKDNKERTEDHKSKHGRYDKQEKQSGTYKKQYQEQFSYGDENDTFCERNVITNRIRSSVHKIEYKSRDDYLIDEHSDANNSDNCLKVSRTDSSKYKSKKSGTEKDKKKDFEKHYQEQSSSEAVDARIDQIRSKSDRIRSSVQKIENKHRNDKIFGESTDDNDNYGNDLSTEKSKYKSKHYEIQKDKSRHSDKFNEEYSSKRKRDFQSEDEKNDDKSERNTEEHRIKKLDERNSHFQDNTKGNFESKAPSDSADAVADSAEPLSKRQKIANINMRTGGAYIPPARLRMMQESIKDKGSEEYQRIAWEALKKSIVGMTNKVNSSNITEIIPELFKENIIRGRGVLARAIMQAQAASPTFTRVYAALVAIINTKFPEIGELILKRLIIQYKRGFRRNDKTICMTAARFLAHLLNQEVAHEVLILEMVTHLLENPTEDSVEIAIATLKECGKKLTQLTARGMRAITQRVRDVLHEASIDMRVRYMIEVFFAVQKDGFKDFEVISPELDLVEEDDKYTHLINLDDAVDGQDMLNVFKFDPKYIENEEKYKSVVNEILGDSSDESGNESDDESEEDDEKEENDGSDQKIIDMTETNLVCLRRKIYLTIQSSLDFEECAHKLLKLELKPGQILEMCYMILDCCAQQRTYEKFYGLLAQRFCQLNKIYVEPFTEIFENSYKTIHRLETNKLRNVAKFFAHLLYTDAISWNVLSIIKLNEDDTTSSSRIFIKILFQELCEYMGLPKLNERVKDVTLQEAFEGLFPRDHPHNTRFAINFFTSIGLGGLTDELREHLKNLPKNPVPVVPDVTALSQSSSSDSSSSESSSSSSSTTSSSSDSDTNARKHGSSKKKKIPAKRNK